MVLSFMISGSITAATGGLDATYIFENPNGGMSPIVKRVDQTIDFSYTAGVSPVADYPSTYYTAIWTGTITALADGEYTLYMTADDCARLWVGEKWVINHMPFSGSAATTVEGTVNLKGGIPTPIMMRLWQFGGLADAKLEWSGPGISRQVIPANVLSNTGWTRIDAPSSSYESPTSALIHYRRMETPLITARPSSALVSPITEIGQMTKWAEVKLSRRVPVAITVNAGDQSARKVISWKAIDFNSNLPTEINIRAGSKILVVTRAGGAPYLTYGYDRKPTSAVPSKARYHEIPIVTAGRYILDDNMCGGKQVIVNAVGLPVNPMSTGGAMVIPAKYTAKIEGVEIVPANAASIVQARSMHHCVIADSLFDTTRSKLDAWASISAIDGNTVYSYLRLGDSGPILSLVPMIGCNSGCSAAEIDITNPDGSTSGVANFEFYPYLKNLEFTMSMRAHMATFLDGNTSFKVKTDGSPTSLGEPGISEKIMSDGTIRGAMKLRVYFPPGEHKWCFTAEPTQISIK